MNYLAHLRLAGPSDASRIGNLLGDFVKGTPESLRPRFPAEVIRGIVMHRRLDRFTDDHPAFHRGRALLAPTRRRLAGIIVDVFFDHFLTKYWDDFGTAAPLPEFLTEIYDTLERHPTWLSNDLARILPRLRRENWLLSYGSLPGLTLTFERIARRSVRLAGLRDAADELATHYDEFAELFLEFFPDVREHAQRLLSAEA